MDTRATIEVILETAFSTRSVQTGYKEDNCGNLVNSVREVVKKGLEGEDEEAPLLEAVTRQLLMKTLRAGKDL
jgi:hypothetical protein